jgi:hypothetical protein
VYNQPLNVTATFECLNANTVPSIQITQAPQTANSRLQYNNYMNQGADGISSYLITADLGVYYVSFIFPSEQDYSYSVTVAINGQALHSVRYRYALHTADIKDNMSLKPDTCKELQCLNYYRTDSLDNSLDGSLTPWDRADMNYSSWRDICRMAGCLFAAGIDGNMDDGHPNTVGMIVESGIWHRSQYLHVANLQGVHTLPVYTSTWQASLSFQVTVYVQHATVVCNHNETQPHTCSAHSQVTHAANQTCPRIDAAGRRRKVWWRPCENVSAATTNIKLGTETGILTSTTAHIEDNVYITSVQVSKPGTYWITATARPLDLDGNRSDPNALTTQTLPMQAIIGPGQLSLRNSPLLPPRASEWTFEKDPVDPTHLLFLPSNQKSSHVEWPDFKPSDDPYYQNPRAGPGSPTWLEYNLTLVANDKHGHRRYGTDQMFMKISRVKDGDPEATQEKSWASSAQLLQGASPLTICHATRWLRSTLNARAKTPGSIPAHLQDCFNAARLSLIQNISTGQSCCPDKAGSFEIRPIIKDSGVFRLEVWLCPLAQLMTASGLVDCLQPKSNSQARPASTPDYQSYAPGGSDEVELRRADNVPSLVFTVCPANADTTSGKWSDLHFMEGAYLHTCTCSSGYMGRKGKPCKACPKGRYSANPGGQDCVECQPGKHCSCSTSSKCNRRSEDPACTQCEACNAGKYQMHKGQGNCVECLKGATDCRHSEMTYPVAFEGYFISPKDPTIVHECGMGSTVMNCPGGDLANATDLKCILDDDLNLISQADPLKSAQCQQAVGAVCSEGYSGNGLDSCKQCCKTNEVRPDNTVCTENWYKQNNACNKCDKKNGAFIIAIATIIGLVFAPIILKGAEMMKHAGALQAPVMSMIKYVVERFHASVNVF